MERPQGFGTGVPIPIGLEAMAIRLEAITGGLEGHRC